MHFKIYQLDGDSPRYHDLVFRPLLNGQRVNLSDYKMIYEGEHEAATPNATLTSLFHVFNIDHPADYAARSMSMSDIVQLDGRAAFYCDRVGWVELTPDLCDGALS